MVGSEKFTWFLNEKNCTELHCTLYRWSTPYPSGGRGRRRSASWSFQRCLNEKKSKKKELWIMSYPFWRSSRYWLIFWFSSCTLDENHMFEYDDIRGFRSSLITIMCIKSEKMIKKNIDINWGWEGGVTSVMLNVWLFCLSLDEN